MTDLVEPVLPDVLAAAARIRPHLSPTPLRRSPAASESVGADVYLKHEFHLPTGAFKVRGGVNLVSQLSAKEREVGVIAASTGNHGQSVAYAARLFGVKAIICAPENANAAKVEAMRELGATVNLVGADFDEAREACERQAVAEGYRYIHSGNEPLLIAGVATHTLEILTEEPRIDVIIVPVGGGSGAAGACIVAKTVNPRIAVIGVQAEKAPSAYLTWRSRPFRGGDLGRGPIPARTQPDPRGRRRGGGPRGGLRLERPAGQSARRVDIDRRQHLDSPAQDGARRRLTI